MERKELQAVIKRLGGSTQVGARLGITAVAVHKWKQVPLRRVHKFAEISGIAVEELRPDFFGRAA